MDWGLGEFVEAARRQNLGVVISGGLIGGLLQPIVAKLNPRSDDPTTSKFFLSPLLGVAAAGVSIYAIANSKTSDPIHLLFFALLCGLAFPAVLSSAIDTVTRRGSQVQERVEAIAHKAEDDSIEQTSQAASELKTTLVQNTAASVNQKSQDAISNAAERAVSNIAQTAIADESAGAQVVEELRELGTVANTAGWQTVAQAATNQLHKIRDTLTDDAVKTAASQAIKRIARDS